MKRYTVYFEGGVAAGYGANFDEAIAYAKEVFQGRDVGSVTGVRLICERCISVNCVCVDKYHPNAVVSESEFYSHKN